MTRKSDKLYNLFSAIEDVKNNAIELACDCLPKEVAFHLRAARKERLLAIRSMIDATLEKMDDCEKPTATSEKVEVE